MTTPPQSDLDASRSIFRRHPVPTWIYDVASLTILDGNDAAVERYGVSREGLIGMTVEELQSRIGRLQLSEIGLRSGEDGTGVAILESGVVGARMPATLEASAVRRRAMASASDMAIIETDESGLIIGWNEGATSMFGHTDAEMVGRPMALIMPERYRERHSAGIDRLRSGGEARVLGRTLVVEGLRRDGTEFPLHLSLSAWEADGRRYFTGLIRDITLQRRGEELLGFLAGRDWANGKSGFLAALTEYLGRVLGVDYVIVDRLRPGGIAETVAISARGEPMPNLQYALDGTPCSDVVGRGLCHFPEGVQKLFPEDELLVEAGAESYLGIPLGDSSGKPIGIMLIMDGKPMPDTRLARSLLQLSSVRAASELERLSHLELIQEREVALSDAQRRSNSGGYLVNVRANSWESSSVLDEILGIGDDFERSLDNWASLIHPHDLSALMAEVWKQGSARQQIVDREYRIVRPADQAERWVHEIGVLEYGPDRWPIRMRGTIQDITPRRRLEAQMRLQASALDATANAMVITDSKGDIEWVNPAFELLTGYPAGECVGRNPRDLVRSGRVPRSVYSDLWQTISSGRVWKGTMVNRRKDGTLFLEESVVTPVMDSENRISHYIAVKEDVTEQRRTAEQLQRQAALLDAASDAIYVMRFDETITFWSDGAERIYGWTSDEAVGRAISELYGAERSTAEGARAALLSQGSWSGEARRRSKGGNEIAVSCRWTLLRGEEGNPHEILAIDTDVTEESRLRAELLQAQKIESIGQLAGGVAHDFNNLLTVISGGTELALGDLAEDSPLREDLLAVRHAAGRAGGLTRQLLAFSRRQIMRLEVLKLGELVVGLEDMLRRTIGEQIRLEIDVDPHAGRVRVDRSQIEQVVLNLVVNARDAMGSGGTLRISVRPVPPEPDQSADDKEKSSRPMLELIVADNGCGMDAITLNRIFEPFFTTKGVGQGTGLGMSTVYGIIKQSGGSVRVESTLGAGTTVVALLPVVSSTETPMPPAASSLAEGSETILIVEDDEALRKLGVRILERAGYRVLAASSGEDALALEARTPDTIHLMVTDVVMPGIGGPELAARLGGRRPDMKVLFSSGYAEDATLQKRVGDMNKQFLHKPYSPADLTRRVRLLLDEKITAKAE